MIECFSLYVLTVCVDVMVMSSSSVVSFIGAYGVGMSYVYMLNSVGDVTPPCGTPVLNWCCVSECSIGFMSFDVVCDEFENGV